MSTGKAALFRAGKAYGRFRPSYPKTLYAELEKYWGHGRGNAAPSHIVDVGAGTGLASVQLADAFPSSAVTGVEASESMIENATWHERVTYVHGSAHELPVGTGAASMVTVAQALHWFYESGEDSTFFSEARRVLCPGGVLGIWSYGTPHVCNSVADGLLSAFHGETMGEYWDAERQLVNDEYKDVFIPEAGFEDHQRLSVEGMTYNMPISQFMNYVRTWSCLGTFAKKHPDAVEETVRTFNEAFCAAYGSDSDTTTMIDVGFHLTLLLARKEDGDS